MKNLSSRGERYSNWNRLREESAAQIKILLLRRERCLNGDHLWEENAAKMEILLSRGECCSWENLRIACKWDAWDSKDKALKNCCQKGIELLLTEPKRREGNKVLDCLEWSSARVHTKFNKSFLQNINWTKYEMSNAATMRKLSSRKLRRRS